MSKKVTNPRGSKERRANVLKGLEAQLKTGLKYFTGKDEEGREKTTVSKLEEQDVKRIKKEIETLKTRI